jgi:hypothetical protein
MRTVNEGDFSIVVPEPNTIRQGGTQPMRVRLKRSSKFRKDVTMTFNGDGVVVTPLDLVVKVGDNGEVRFTVGVPIDARIGDHQIEVNGTPTSGETEFSSMVVNVVER